MQESYSAITPLQYISQQERQKVSKRSFRAKRTNRPISSREMSSCAYGPKSILDRDGRARRQDSLDGSRSVLPR